MFFSASIFASIFDDVFPDFSPKKLPKWCLAAVKGTKNMILKQTWCQKDAKWTENDPKVVQNHQTYHKMMPKGYQSAPKREPKRARDLQKGAVRKSIDF